MQLPQKLLSSLRGLKGFDQDAFENAHDLPCLTSIRINPLKVPGPASLDFDTGISQVPWTKYGHYLSIRPSFTFDPLFHAGCYYVQEASSMFLEQALRQHADLTQQIRILDLSAAPGGKSTHIQSLISRDSLLVSNEVIRSRANILKDNIIKWGGSNTIVTQNDPREFSSLAGFFDVIVVDAPCSGSGLFRREPEAMDEWSENNVQLCMQRQRRILADIWPSLKAGGILIYSTCSYSKDEDEDIVDWMTKEFDATSLEINTQDSWGVEDVETYGGVGYRFWPHKVQGEGFFLSCVRKNEGDDRVRKKTDLMLQFVSKKEKIIIGQWIETDEWEFVKYKDTIYAWPAKLVQGFQTVLSSLRTVYSGTIIGDLMKEKLVPHHALAMNPVIATKTSSVDVVKEQAIAYLQRKELKITPNTPGWQQVKYEGFSLGWINALSNRINNYYPKELRIIKDF